MPIEPIPALSGGTPAVRSPKQALDGEVFMQLLVTQLQNQDPSSPMDTNAMIAQTTQLAMMEKLNDLSATGTESFSLQMRMAAASLIGRDVNYQGSDGESLVGRVNAVSYSGSVPAVTVDGHTVPLDAIGGVAEPKP